MWCFCGGGRFSYGEPPRTPPLEGTSLHRRNFSVERPWGILSLFTTCFRLQVNSWACLRPVSDYRWIRIARSCDTDMFVASLWSRSFFLRWITADPSPWRNFTPPTKYERGETLGDLEPVYDLFSITSEFGLPEAVPLCETRSSESGDSYSESSRTPHIEETWFWRDLGGVRVLEPV